MILWEKYGVIVYSFDAYVFLLIINNDVMLYLRIAIWNKIKHHDKDLLSYFTHQIESYIHTNNSQTPISCTRTIKRTFKEHFEISTEIFVDGTGSYKRLLHFTHFLMCIINYQMHIQRR